jgi:hypothetical protein
MGVGYGFDQLYVVDLTSGEKKILPSRYAITKATAHSDGKYSAAQCSYLGLEGVVEKATNHKGEGVNKLFTEDSIHAETFLYTEDGTSSSWSLRNVGEASLAFVGDGTAGTATHKIRQGFFNDTSRGGDEMVFDFDTCETLLNDDGTPNDNTALIDWAYRYLTPSAWDFITANMTHFADLPKVIKDLEAMFHQLYGRSRATGMSRIRAPLTAKLALSLSELGHTIRRARFSPNVAFGNNSSVTHGTKIKYNSGSIQGAEITSGVLNDLFMVVQDRFLIAPWWLVDKLNMYTFVDDERELEQRDIERRDVIEAAKLLFEAADYEKGLHHGGDSTIKMILFEKYSEGKLRSFEADDFKSSESALAAALLGFKNPREAFYNRKSESVDKVNYFHQLPNWHGTLMGSEHAEFMDKIQEQAKHAVTVASVENFKAGMQVTSSFGYQAMFGRTRFGDHHIDINVYPVGFMRQVQTLQFYKAGDNGDLAGGWNEGTALSEATYSRFVDNVVWFPLVNWAQYGEAASTEGFLRLGQNGASFTAGYDSTISYCDNYGTLGADLPNPFVGVEDQGITYSNAHIAGLEHGVLWCDGPDTQYNEPGVQNYSARMLSGTNDLYRQWTDRADTIRTEGVTAPVFGQVNLVAEMSYDTPLAMVTRNFPFLRKMMTVPTVTNAAAEAADPSFDFMTAGDDIHGTSVWRASTMFKLEDRQLFNSEVHSRDGALDLMPGVVCMTSAPDNWVEIFQLRDWLAFHTSYYSEPIMDAYPASVGATTRSNSYGSARLMTYQEQVEFDGSVRDVLCTPIAGSFNDNSLDYSSAPSTGVSLHPAAATALNTYEVYLLGVDRARAGTSVHMRGSLPSDMTEDDFVPGLQYAKLWVQNEDVYSLLSDRHPTWAELFTDVTSTVNNGVAASPEVNVAYLAPAFTSSAGNITVSSLDNTDSSSMASSLPAGASSMVLTNKGVIDWVHAMGRFLETKREELEFQHAQPIFFILDKDVLDKTESRIRMTRAPFNESTIGPITFIGGMTPEGTSALAETITGDDRYTIINLSSGTGASASETGDPDADDLGEGEENPSLHVAEKQVLE